MYAGTMTIDQALEAMKAGHKVANSYFTSSEYLHLVDGVITSEDGYDFTGWFADRRPESRFKYDGLCWLIREDLPEQLNKPTQDGKNVDEWQSIDPGYFWEELAVIEKEKRLK